MPPKKQKKQIAIEDEIERTTHNLEELLKETTDIKNMVKQPATQLDIENSKEFDRFIEELNNSDIEQKEKQTSIQGFNSPSRDEIPNPQRNHEDEINKLMGSLQNTDNRDPPKDERERIMESLQNDITSKQKDDVTNIDSDIDIDISDFDKLIE